MRKRRKTSARRKNPVIALAQIKYFDTAENHNVKKIKKYISLAKSKGADIICFSESTIHKNDFLSFNHKLVEEIREECRKNSIWCIVDDDMMIKGKIYNAAILIDRKGKIAGEYRKINLMGEGYDSPVKAGKEVKVFKTDFAKIGIAICWDLAYPDLFRKMKKKGAEIVFCPTYWKYELHAHHIRKYKEKQRERERWTLKSLIMTRAFENLFFVALCNPAKNNYEKDLVSYSAIASPHKILAEIKDKEGLIVKEIRMSEIGKLEKIYKEAV
ncbi:MAG TPA: carbon-nitrogen hydrolase family protein [Patescibacteria group bacterium]|nr:carbon-nitrogen hydrolase family protein [Patescibacteria group bacterium]